MITYAKTGKVFHARLYPFARLSTPRCGGGICEVNLESRFAFAAFGQHQGRHRSHPRGSARQLGASRAGFGGLAKTTPTPLDEPQVLIKSPLVRIVANVALDEPGRGVGVDVGQEDRAEAVCGLDLQTQSVQRAQTTFAPETALVIMREAFDLDNSHDEFATATRLAQIRLVESRGQFACTPMASM